MCERLPSLSWLPLATSSKTAAPEVVAIGSALSPTVHASAVVAAAVNESDREDRKKKENKETERASDHSGPFLHSINCSPSRGCDMWGQEMGSSP